MIEIKAIRNNRRIILNEGILTYMSFTIIIYLLSFKLGTPLFFQSMIVFLGLLIFIQICIRQSFKYGNSITRISIDQDNVVLSTQDQEINMPLSSFSIYKLTSAPIKPMQVSLLPWMSDDIFFYKFQFGKNIYNLTSLYISNYDIAKLEDYLKDQIRVNQVFIPLVL